MTSDNHWIWQCDRVIPSKTEAGRRVLQELMGQLKARRWGRHELFCVHLAMEEALLNAIKHGNRLDPAKQVHVTCRIAPDLVRIEIADEGKGFDPSSVPDPTAPDRLESPGGRGLFLIRAFMSRVVFNESGNRMILEKDRNHAQPSVRQKC